MYLMYGDESGDSGIVNSPTRYFVLSGLVLHELRWQPYLDHLVKFRRSLKQAYGMRLREEFHAAAMITRPGIDLMRMSSSLRDRVQITRHLLDYPRPKLTRS
jgi:hypothetical protein